MNKNVLIGIIIAIIVVIGGVWVYMSMQQTPSQPASDSPASSTTSPTITYTDNGFSPDSLDVKVGDTIKVINKSSSPLQFSSDDHPTHLKDPELNLAALSPDQETTVKVTVAGMWGYHNHLKSSHKGMLTVE